VSPAKPGQQEKVVRPEPVAPAKPSQQEKPGQPAGPERTKTQKLPQEQLQDQPGQQEKQR
jgi:hypothetical protein